MDLSVRLGRRCRRAHLLYFLTGEDCPAPKRSHEDRESLPQKRESLVQNPILFVGSCNLVSVDLQ